LLKNISGQFFRIQILKLDWPRSGSLDLRKSGSYPEKSGSVSGAKQKYSLVFNPNHTFLLVSDNFRNSCFSFYQKQFKGVWNFKNGKLFTFCSVSGFGNNPDPDPGSEKKLGSIRIRFGSDTLLLTIIFNKNHDNNYNKYNNKKKFIIITIVIIYKGKILN